MKQFFLAFSVSVMAAAAVQAQAKPKLKVVNPLATNMTKPVNSILKSTSDSFSYALGMNIAKNLQQQGIEKISNAAMQKGLDDIFNKKIQ